MPSFGGDQNRQKEIDTLKQKLKKEQESNEELRNNYIEAVDDTEQCHVKIQNLETAIDDMKKDVDKEDLRKVIRESQSKEMMIEHLKTERYILKVDLNVSEKSWKELNKMLKKSMI